MLLFASPGYSEPQLLKLFNENFEFNMPLRGRYVNFNTTVRNVFYNNNKNKNNNFVYSSLMRSKFTITFNFTYI